MRARSSAGRRWVALAMTSGACMPDDDCGSERCIIADASAHCSDQAKRQIDTRRNSTRRARQIIAIIALRRTAHVQQTARGQAEFEPRSGIGTMTQTKTPHAAKAEGGDQRFGAEFGFIVAVPAHRV